MNSILSGNWKWPMFTLSCSYSGICHCFIWEGFLMVAIWYYAMKAMWNNIRSYHSLPLLFCLIWNLDSYRCFSHRIFAYLPTKIGCKLTYIYIWDSVCLEKTASELELCRLCYHKYTGKGKYLFFARVLKICFFAPRGLIHLQARLCLTYINTLTQWM